jgi:biofilm PGA synthesis protein PgaD
MEKSGPGLTKPRQLIINSRGSLRLRDRWAEVGVTLFFWLLLIYMWQPLLSVLAWFFQGYVFYHHMVTLEGYQSFSDSVLRYFLLILLFGGVFLLWARINLWRFRGNERRETPPDTLLLEQSLYFNVDPVAVQQWRCYKRMVVAFDEQGNMVNAVSSLIKKPA